MTGPGPWRVALKALPYQVPFRHTVIIDCSACNLNETRCVMVVSCFCTSGVTPRRDRQARKPDLQLKAVRLERLITDPAHSPITPPERGRPARFFTTEDHWLFHLPFPPDRVASKCGRDAGAPKPSPPDRPTTSKAQVWTLVV
jgi:hypothetical protein